jgi:inorganic pyrophosphatase
MIDGGGRNLAAVVVSYLHNKYKTVTPASDTKQHTIKTVSTIFFSFVSNQTTMATMIVKIIPKNKAA